MRNAGFGEDSIVWFMQVYWQPLANIIDLHVAFSTQHIKQLLPVD
jgi:hypothetical protein